jgi:multiple sugar transport system substrate-binding protein
MQVEVMMDITGIKTAITRIVFKIRMGVSGLLPEKLCKFFGTFHKISADKVLWIWAVMMIAGLFLFKLVSGNLPGMSTTLVFAQWWEEELDEATLANLTAEFEAQNPGVSVLLERKSWIEIRELLEMEDDKKKEGAPDLFSIDPYAIYDLKDTTLSVLLGSGEAVNGAWPVISFISPLFYNIELLQAAGFDRPPKNQTEFVSYAQRINQNGNGVYGAGLALGDNEPRSVSRHLLSWIWAAAGNPQTSDTLEFNSKQIVAALTFLNQLKPGLYPSPFTLNEAELLTAFSEGKIGMMIGSIADARMLKEKMSGNFGITTIPGPASYERKPVFPLSVWYAGINRQTEHPEEAQKFISFLMEKEGILAAAAYAVPGNGRRNPELSKNDPHYAKAFDMYEAGEMVKELYGSPKAAKLNGIIREEVKRMFEGLQSPAEAAEALQLRWENL